MDARRGKEGKVESRSGIRFAWGVGSQIVISPVIDRWDGGWEAPMYRHLAPFLFWIGYFVPPTPFLWWFKYSKDYKKEKF